MATHIQRDWATYLATRTANYWVTNCATRQVDEINCSFERDGF
jgi:hypothetical protein